MKAVVLASGRVEVAERERPPLPAGEARVRVRRAGICSTDLALAQGYMGFSGVPGHEFVGEVIEGPAEWLGARVVGAINAACGDCADCVAGRGRHCPRRTVLGILARPGAHADELLLPLANLHRVPATISDDAAVFVEPLAAAWQVVEQVAVAGRRVAVLGAGKLGQLVARAATIAGGEVVGAARSARQRELLDAAGIAACPPADLARRAYDVVVECTGSADGLALALAHVRPLGTVVLKTTTHRAATLDLAPLVVDEVTVVGSRCGRFEPALDLLARGAVDPRPLIEATLPLAAAAEAYRRAAAPGALKVLLAPAGGAGAAGR